MIKQAIAKAVDGAHLSEEEMAAAMTEVMEGRATPAQIGALLVALRTKGETVEEITGAAKVMRAKAAAVNCRPSADGVLADTCGTGGDGLGTFNVSTVTAFVVAGAGVPVAKHGNRAVSSSCGSADVMEALGVSLELTPEQVAACVDQSGIGFLFAPALHAAMRFAIGPRRELGLRTIFNVLGPLTNPAGANVQVLGVYDPQLTTTLAQVLGRLGSRAAYVVHGMGGYDELTVTGPNRVSRLAGGKVEDLVLAPEDLGLKRAKPEDLAGGDAVHNAALIRAVLDGEPGPKRDMVLINAAAALAAAGRAADLAEGVKLAAKSIDEGAARQKLADLAAQSQRLAATAPLAAEA